MTDNVIPFRKRQGSDQPNRQLTIEIGQWASQALDRRVQAEGVNKTTAFNRAILVYDDLITSLGGLGPGEYLELTLHQFPNQSFVIARAEPKTRKFKWPWKTD